MASMSALYPHPPERMRVPAGQDAHVPSLAAQAREFVLVVEDAAVGFGLARRDLHLQRSVVNLKVSPDAGDREHFELQLLRSPTGNGLAVEIGFHAEHKEVSRNEAALAALLQHEARWRPSLPDAVAGPFAQGAKAWRRVSELWDGMSFDEGVAVEAGEQLVRYVDVLLPLLQRARNRSS